MPNQPFSAEELVLLDAIHDEERFKLRISISYDY